jgi:hypothetical protein
MRVQTSGPDFYPICSFCLTAPTVTAFGWKRTVVAPSLPKAVQDFLRAAQLQLATACQGCAPIIRAKDLNGLRIAAFNKYSIALERANTMKEKYAAKARFQNALLKQCAYWTSLAELPERVLDLVAFLRPGFRSYFEIVESGNFDETCSTVTFGNGTALAIMTDDMTLQPETLVSLDRREGNADAVISLLTAAADLHGATIEMIAEPFEREGVPLGPDLDGLLAWYRRHGFEMIMGHDHPGALRRHPRSGTPDLLLRALQNAREMVSRAG